jgi:hypothetical protein
MIVKEASYPSLEWRCLLQITDATGAVKVAGRNPAFFREVGFNRLRVRSDLPHGARWPKRSAHLVPAANRTGTQRSFCRDVP